MNAQKFTRGEVMAAAVSHQLKDGERGYTGLPTGSVTNELVIGVPLVAMALAKRTHAPNLTIMLAGWVLDPTWEELPAEGLIGEYEDKILGLTSLAHLDEMEHLFQVRHGFVDVGFITGAQIDMYGNINTVCIGDYSKPKVRLIGPLFLQQHMSNFNREVILMRHEKRRFVEKVDFISAVGYLNGPGTRESAGLKRGGPFMVVTDLAILGFDEKSKRMKLVSVHPGVTVEQVRENTGFELLMPERVPETQVPTQREVDLIRTVIDPHGVFLPKF